MRKFKIVIFNGIVTTISSLVMQSVGFYFMIYISNKIGSETLGIFNIIMSIYMFFKVYYPQKKKYFYLLLSGWSFYIFMRWFYSGAGLYLIPKNIYYDNLFYLIGDYI